MNAPAFFDIATHGQVFTAPAIVDAILGLRRNQGRVLEPACGDGAFAARLPDCVAIEIDPRHCPRGALNIDFFAYPETEKFDTIIGNPPYVRYQDIPASTRRLLRDGLFDARTNLYLFFIEKCIRHLALRGELIFITPRDFLKATAAVKLNRWLHEQGTITDAIELGDALIFADAKPNCLIWRFQLGNFQRETRYVDATRFISLEEALDANHFESRKFAECAGHLLFTRQDYPLRFSELFFVKVGAVSAADEIFTHEKHGNLDFVCSTTAQTGELRRMIYNECPPYLQQFKQRLLERRIRKFDESNWWQWGRGYHQSAQPRIYVNAKTRNPRPFFVHTCPNYDGAVLAIFPHDPAQDVHALCAALNEVDWNELGFVCDGRFLFSQRSLENAPLPQSFARFMPGK